MSLCLNDVNTERNNWSNLHVLILSQFVLQKRFVFEDKLTAY